MILKSMSQTNDVNPNHTRCSSINWEIPNYNMDVNNDVEQNKKKWAKEYLAKLTKDKLTPNLILDMVNLF